MLLSRKQKRKHQKNDEHFYKMQVLLLFKNENAIGPQKMH